MSAPPRLFDRRLLGKRRARAAAGLAGDAGFLHREIADRLLDRLSDFAKHHERALAIGFDASHPPIPAPFTVHADLAPARLPKGTGRALAADEEALPFREESFDLVLSLLTLHWTNDLPGTLIQMRRLLRPDGLLLGAMIGGASLAGLRRALIDAETAITGRSVMRVSPMVEIRDLGSLLGRAGFAMPVVDADLISISYDTPFALLRDLRVMGESAAPATGPIPPLRRDVLAEAMRLYAERHSDAEGRMAAEFEILTLTGWAPAPDQPQPKPRGSALIGLAEALAAARRG